MKFIVGKLAALLLAGNNKFSFQNEKLQNAAKLYDEAQTLARDKHWNEACDVYMQGIFMGRKIVQDLLDTNDEESQLALDWMVSSYLECSRARMELGDWAKARSDVWAACTYSNNENVETLLCMLHVCENTGDLLGELQTLKTIQALPSTTEVANSRIGFDVENRILMTEQRLDQKFNRS